MNFDLNNINNAIVHSFAELLDGDAQCSAKALQATIASFFIETAGITRGVSENENVPESYCYPFGADLPSLTKMCEAIFAQVEVDKSCRHSQLRLICKMCELSESYMARFRQERDAGEYARNVGYICELSPENDWGRWMMALKDVFNKKYLRYPQTTS